MEKLSIIYSYYNQPEMLKSVIGRINSYSDYVRDNIEVIFIDDGSIKHPIEVQNIRSECKFIKIEKDIGFNNGGAKNIGIKHSSYNWCLLLDLDHWFDNDALESLLMLCNGDINLGIMDKLKLRRGIDSYWYLIERIGTNGETCKPNPNVKLVRRDVIIRFLYDEDFSGYYGYEDVFQMRQLNKEIGKYKILPNIKINVDATNSDANTISITNRDTSRNKKLLDDKLEGVIKYTNYFFREKYTIL